MGLEQLFYQVYENASMVEVCATVYSPNITCLVESNFIVNLSTSDANAGIYFTVKPGPPTLGLIFRVSSSP